MQGASLDRLVSEVMGQLKGFVPVGGVVHFEVNLGIGLNIGVYDALHNTNNSPQNTVSFYAIMPDDTFWETNPLAD